MNGKETSTGWEMPFRILSLATAVGCLLSGCASGFAKFYTPAPNAQIILNSPRVLPAPETPQLFLHSNDVQADAKRWPEDGYVYIGNSSSYGPANRSNQSQAIEQGKKVRAAIVLLRLNTWIRCPALRPTLLQTRRWSRQSTRLELSTLTGRAAMRVVTTIRVVQFEWHDYDPRWLQHLRHTLFC